jgi:uncharacterized Zn finger protein
MKAPGADPSAKLAATMLEVALAEIAEPQRLRRGRSYARQGAVVDLVVAPGLVTGAVQGSRSLPYDVEIRLAQGSVRERSTGRPTDLVPNASHLSFRCTCPDWELPCKHGAAVMTQLAERVAYDSTLLATWRGLHESDGPDAAEAPDDRATPASSDTALSAEVKAFLGTAPDFALPELRPLPHVTMSWDEPWSVMLHDALRVLSGGHSAH